MPTRPDVTERTSKGVSPRAMHLASVAASARPADFGEAIAFVAAVAAVYERASSGQRAALRAAAADEAGLLRRSRSRKCGVGVSPYLGAESGIDVESRYVLVCDDHGGTTGFDRRDAAESFMPVPDQWCPYCRGDE
mgnify:FL=1